jgi:phosphomannomutase/phosphoglucomutase
MSIYKDCDIRGIYSVEFDENDAYKIGRAVGTMMTGKTLVVGGDVRLSTPILKERLIAGLRESGANIKDIGTIPTPVFYFSLKKLDADGGVMVTASHNPAKYNGFKLMLGNTPITVEVIKSIENCVKSGKFSTGSGSFENIDITTDYITAMSGFFEPCKLKVVLDCCNGAAGDLAPRLFELMGYDLVKLYCEFDGRFPNRDPNPAVYENLTDLKKKVLETGADLGAAFDGDGDRVVFVDDRGRVINSERSFVVFIREYLKEAPSSIVYDIKSSSVVKDTVLELGGEPILERSGHAFIKRTFLEHKSALAGEISGHFFFRELGYDDGIYAALRMAQIVAKSGEKLSDIIDRIPSTLITPDIRVFCHYDKRDGWLKRVQEAGKQFEISVIDGVRVDFPYGWLLVRKSVTEECITLRIEANNEGNMQEIKSWILKVLPEIPEELLNK